MHCAGSISRIFSDAVTAQAPTDERHRPRSSVGKTFPVLEAKGAGYRIRFGWVSTPGRALPSRTTRSVPCFVDLGKAVDASRHDVRRHRTN